MTAVAVAFLVAMTPTVGAGSQYAPGVMDLVIRNRQAGRTAHDLPMDLSAFVGFAAVERCDQVGQVLLVSVDGGPVEVWLAADCGGIADGGAAWMRRNGIIIEMDARSRVRHGVPLLRTVPVAVWFTGVPAEVWGSEHVPH